MTLPTRVELGLIGAKKGDHTFFVHVEEPYTDTTITIGGDECFAPWLRPACSCRWVGGDRYTLEHNAFWKWNLHVKKDV